MNKDLERRLGYHGESSRKPDSAECRKVGVRRSDGGGVTAEYKTGGRIKRADGGDVSLGDLFSNFGDMPPKPHPFGLKKGGKVRRSDGGGVDPEYKKGGRICRADGGGVDPEYKKGGHAMKGKNKDVKYLERDERYDVKNHRGKNAHHAIEDIIHDMKPSRRAMGGAQKVRLDQNY